MVEAELEDPVGGKHSVDDVGDMGGMQTANRRRVADGDAPRYVEHRAGPRNTNLSLPVHIVVIHSGTAKMRQRVPEQSLSQSLRCRDAL